MSFFFLLIIALLFFILWPVLRLLFAVKSATSRARQAFTGQQQRQQEPQTQTRKKVFTREDGEYVDFEDIAVSSTSSSRNASRSDNFTPESQISDAEWEDIK